MDLSQPHQVKGDLPCSAPDPRHSPSSAWPTLAWDSPCHVVQPIRDGGAGCSAFTADRSQPPRLDVTSESDHAWDTQHRDAPGLAYQTNVSEDPPGRMQYPSSPGTSPAGANCGGSWRRGRPDGMRRRRGLAVRIGGASSTSLSKENPPARGSPRRIARTTPDGRGGCSTSTHEISRSVHVRAVLSPAKPGGEHRPSRPTPTGAPPASLPTGAEAGGLPRAVLSGAGCHDRWAASPRPATGAPVPQGRPA